MERLKQEIQQHGKVIGTDILKVDSFLNHQLNPGLLYEIGGEFKRIFQGENITKVVTVEASGIAIGIMTALHFNVPMVFAKKTVSNNLDPDCYCTDVISFTRQNVYDVRISKKYLSKDDRILIVDDFLANGNAAIGLCNIIKQADAHLVGIGVAIEKGFQGAGDKLRENGIRLESLAIIESMSEDEIVFR